MSGIHPMRRREDLPLFNNVVDAEGNSFKDVYN